MLGLMREILRTNIYVYMKHTEKPAKMAEK